MVFTWKIFTNLVEKEVTILISGERHEIAKRLRILASHASADTELVNDLLGLYPGEYVDGYDPCNIQHLADLIESKDRTCRMEYNGINRGVYCSNCGERMDIYTCDLYEDGTMKYSYPFCCECGARVVK